MKYGLPPIVNKDCKILILGSLPGEASLKAEQYYAHPQNQFWPIMATILKEDLPDNYAQKTAMLLEHQIALWDVIHFAEREGSLDSNIKNAVPNDFVNFLREYPAINKIVLNGNEAEKHYKKHFKELSIPFIKVRSSSPVPAKTINTLAEKIENWRQSFT